jgi:hypothetical protein
MKYPPGCRFKHPALTQKPLMFLRRMSEYVVILHQSRALLGHLPPPNAMETHTDYHRSSKL